MNDSYRVPEWECFAQILNDYMNLPVDVKQYFFDRCQSATAWRTVDAQTRSEVLDEAKKFKQTAHGQFQHMWLAKSQTKKQQSWDYNEQVPPAMFNDWFNHMAGAEDRVLRQWEALMDTIKRGELILSKATTKKGQEVVVKAVSKLYFIVSCL